MERFVKLPIEIEAAQFTGYNAKDLQDWVGRDAVSLESDEKGFIDTFIVHTLEGNMSAKVGDWIIKGIKGEFYPCDDQIFRASYISPPEDEEPRTFQQELASLLNKHSLEGGSDTPDFILASFLANVLTDWNHSVRARDTWRGTDAG
jgi:hypothetical protein